MSTGEQSSDTAGEGPTHSDQGDADIGARVGEYTWDDYFAEFDPAASKTNGALRGGATNSIESTWDTSLDLFGILGFQPENIENTLNEANDRAQTLDSITYDTLDPSETPVRQGEYSWHHFVRDCHDPSHSAVTLPDEFAPEEYLTFPEEALPQQFNRGESAAAALESVIEERTVAIQDDLDEDAFFSSVDGTSTIVTRYDLEKSVPLEKKRHFVEVERYWVNKPFSFVTIFHSEKENETKYYLIEPYRTPIEDDLLEFLTGKLRTSIKYADNIVSDGSIDTRQEVIERETRALLDRYELLESPTTEEGLVQKVASFLGRSESADDTNERSIPGSAIRPEPALLAEDSSKLSEFQVAKLQYYLQRDFIGYERIDGIKHDINVEDISCDGYNSPVFVYHTEYEQIISNVHHGKQRLDDFVIKLAQRSGKGISKRQPQVDATLPDGSRAQLTLGKEVSDHGTNYTIRQFNDVPFTPIDLINWRTFSLEEMAFLWLCIENHKSLIFAGGTASGKTTSLNAVSLFIPSSSKIVSIEDTREVELPQRNWIASVTRPSFSDDDKGDVDEFDLLEAALRQRPEYIVMGEIRGEEGRTLFQVMSTGHTTYTTFHADSVGEVLKRFTTAPINVSKTMFTALDLVSIQTSTRVHGKKVRRNKSLTEINHYDPENDEINVKDIYQWQAETDEFLQLGDSNTLDEILFDRGWDRERLETELFKREVVLAYLIENGFKEYREVAATLQAFINDPETTFGLIANDVLGDSLEDLREMESVLIDVDPEKEELVPRPDPDEAMREETSAILERAEAELFPEYYSTDPGHLSDALTDPPAETDIPATPGNGDEIPANTSTVQTESNDGADDSESMSPPVDASTDEPFAGFGQEKENETAYDESREENFTQQSDPREFERDRTTTAPSDAPATSADGVPDAATGPDDEPDDGTSSTSQSDEVSRFQNSPLDAENIEPVPFTDELSADTASDEDHANDTAPVEDDVDWSQPSEESTIDTEQSEE